MAKQVFFGMIGVVAGIVAGMIVMMSLHMASTLVYPLPEGVEFTAQDPENQDRLKEWFGTLPAGAFVLAIVCHGIGCMAGAVVATLMTGRRSLVPSIIIGVFFTAGGIMNLSSIPHPSWFAFADVPVYLILALVAGVLLKRKSVKESPAATT